MRIELTAHDPELEALLTDLGHEVVQGHVWEHTTGRCSRCGVSAWDLRDKPGLEGDSCKGERR